MIILEPIFIGIALFVIAFILKFISLVFDPEAESYYKERHSRGYGGYNGRRGR